MSPSSTSDPPPDDRSRRAREEPMAVTATGDGYAVATPGGHEYTVTLDEGRCTCPDHRFRGVRCKHVRRVAIEVTLGNVPAPGERDAECANCGRGFFADAGADDPVYCDRCTLAPGETVVDRESGDLVVVVESTDDRASDVRIPERGWTVAEHHSNRPYDADDRVVDVLYPLERGVSPGELAPQDLRRYSFPRGRLRRTDAGTGGAGGSGQ